MAERAIHVGVDATSWSNERGFGRFTRSLLSALAARDAGFRYTLLFDQPPGKALPDGVAMLCATTALPVGGTPAKSPRWVPVMV